jgi:hypothetical protein
MKVGLTLLLLLAMTAPCVAANAFKWVDERGVTHYGDAPPPSATNKQPVDTRPYGVTGGGCGSCDWRSLERYDQRQIAAAAPASASPMSAQQPDRIAQSSARGMDHSVYIRLNNGMDEGELFSRAGPPDRESVENIREDIVKTFYYMPTQANPFITTVKMRGGKIISINRTRSN